MHEDRVLLKPDPDQERLTKAGIKIPDTAEKEPYKFATVLHVGPGVKLMKENDRVMILRGQGIEIDFEDDQLIILRDVDIVALVEDEE